MEAIIGKDRKETVKSLGVKKRLSGKPYPKNTSQDIMSTIFTPLTPC